jgi:hypothetical protein
MGIVVSWVRQGAEVVSRSHLSAQSTFWQALKRTSVARCLDDAELERQSSDVMIACSARARFRAFDALAILCYKERQYSYVAY